MVSTAIRAATQVQIGEEVDRGTLVAATRQLLTKSATFRRIEEVEPFEGQMHGTLGRVAVAPVITLNGVEFHFASDLDFEQILLPLLSGVKGAVTPTTPGTGDARLWTFVPSAVADPLIDTYTIEYVVRNLDASPDEDEWECGYGFTSSIEISGGAEASLPQLIFDMIARKPVASTKTAALSLPSLTHAANLAWKVYFDDTWAGLGGSAISGHVYGFGWSFKEFLSPGYYLDGRADLDFSQYQYRPRVVELTIDAVIDPTAASFVLAEKTDKSAGTARFVRVALTGAAFDSPDEALTRHIHLDGAFLHAADSMDVLGEDRDGSMSVRIHLLSKYDSTGTADFQVAVQNALATFP